MSGDRTQARGNDSCLLISRKQRDLLYERIYRHLAGIDAVWLAASSGDFDKADRLSHILCDELTLVMDDLGWGVQNEDRHIEVSTSPLIVRGVLERLRAEAEVLDPDIDVCDAAAENRELIATCDQLLTSLHAQLPGPPPRGTPTPFSDTPDEQQLALRQTVVAVLRSHPALLSPEEIAESVSAKIGVPVDRVDRALDELLELGLIARGPSGVVASDALVRLSQLWGDLSRVM